MTRSVLLVGVLVVAAAVIVVSVTHLVGGR
jgi:hypothetical protein